MNLHHPCYLNSWFLGDLRQILFTEIKAQLNHRLISLPLLFRIISQNSRRYPEISDRFLSVLEDFPGTAPQGVQRYQVSEFNLMETEKLRDSDSCVNKQALQSCTFPF